MDNFNLIELGADKKHSIPLAQIISQNGNNNIFYVKDDGYITINAVNGWVVFEDNTPATYLLKKGTIIIVADGEGYDENFQRVTILGCMKLNGEFIYHNFPTAYKFSNVASNQEEFNATVDIVEFGRWS